MSLFTLVGLAISSGLAQIAAASPAGNSTASSKTSAVSQSPKDNILFRNGDLLLGSLLSIDPLNGVRWRHPDVTQPIELKPEHVLAIELAPRATGLLTVTNDCFVRLTNQDELAGHLVSLDAERLILETAFAGKLTLPRKRVQSIVPVLPNLATVFDGPHGLDGWTMGKVVSAGTEGGEWKYKNGAFYATRSASIARDIKLPDVATMQFDIAWKGNLQIAIALFTDYMQPVNLANKESEPDFGGFYSLQLNSFFANLLPVKKNDPLRYLGQVSVPSFNLKKAAHIEVRMNKAKRMIALLVDDVLVKQWIDSEDFAGRGTGLRLVHQGVGSVKFSKLLVTEWDGQFDEPSGLAANSKDDFARLRNGDKLVGTVETVRAGKVEFAAAGKTLEIPWGRVKEIELAGQKAERSIEPPTAMRAYFARRGMMTFQLKRWDEQGAVASHPNFGQATFDPAAFLRIEFELESNRNN